ncbi:MAG: hypothetical protein GX047_05730 [Firmicutes bacterium]|nr:hypothetical protein [Bacillota bacterium]
MRKERITKDDGRYLIYYSFDDEASAGDEVNVFRSGDADGCGGCCSGKAKAVSGSEGQDRKGCGPCRN